jgi:ABC-type multidrug transport system fused ATPase/permease subunit
MRRFRTAGLLVVLIVVSALAGYEVGVHQPVWSFSASQIATAPAAEQAASDDVTFSVIFDRTVRQAAEKIDDLAGQLDARSLSIQSVFARLGQFAVGAINFANVLALFGAIFFVATLLMRTIVPLRISAIISDVFFVGYAVLAGSVTTFILYVLLLPINIIRLHQMVKLIRKAHASADGDLSMDWLKPFMTRRKYGRDQLLFRKGDAANEMMYIVTGKFRVSEIGVELGAGRMVGELGFLAPDNRRTQTVECVEDAEVLAITYDKLLELCFQNPHFGYYFLRLSSERLLENNARLAAIIEREHGRVAIRAG